MSTQLSRIESNEVKTKFTRLLAASQNITDVELAESVFEKEKFFFLILLEEDSKLKSTTEISQIRTFLEVVTNGLSFEKIQRHIYLLSRGAKTGQRDSNGKDIYENRLCYEETKDGILYLARQAGSVKDITDPVIVYEGDHCVIRTVNGILLIDHAMSIPRKSKTILGCYFFIIANDGRQEAIWYPVENVERLKTYSAKQNRGVANELYSSSNGQVDESFLMTKAIKNALKNYSKKPIGKPTVERFQPVENANHIIGYNTNDENSQPTYRDEDTARYDVEYAGTYGEDEEQEDYNSFDEIPNF